MSKWDKWDKSGGEKKHDPMEGIIESGIYRLNTLFKTNWWFVQRVESRGKISLAQKPGDVSFYFALKCCRNATVQWSGGRESGEKAYLVDHWTYAHCLEFIRENRDRPFILFIWDGALFKMWYRPLDVDETFIIKKPYRADPNQKLLFFPVNAVREATTEVMANLPDTTILPTIKRGQQTLTF